MRDRTVLGPGVVAVIGAPGVHAGQPTPHPDGTTVAPRKQKLSATHDLCGN